MSRRNNDKTLVIGVLMVCAVAVLAIGAYVKFAPADEVVNIDEKSEQTVGGGVKILVPRFEEDALRFDITEVEVPADQDPRVFAINLSLRGVAAVPENVVALTCTVEDSIATVDFNAAFDRSYGTEDEMIVLKAILMVMGQFEDVSWVRITVEGSEIETIGNRLLTEPLQVIRPGSGEQSAP